MAAIPDFRSIGSRLLATRQTRSTRPPRHLRPRGRTDRRAHLPGTERTAANSRPMPRCNKESHTFCRRRQWHRLSGVQKMRSGKRTVCHAAAASPRPLAFQPRPWPPPDTFALFASRHLSLCKVEMDCLRYKHIKHSLIETDIDWIDLKDTLSILQIK